MLDEQTGEQASDNGSWVHLTVNGWHFVVSTVFFLVSSVSEVAYVVVVIYS